MLLPRLLLSPLSPGISLEHVDDVGEDHQADDGEKHQDENIQHGEQAAGGAGAAGGSLPGKAAAAAGGCSARRSPSPGPARGGGDTELPEPLASSRGG